MGDIFLRLMVLEPNLQLLLMSYGCTVRLSVLGIFLNRAKVDVYTTQWRFYAQTYTCLEVQETTAKVRTY